MNKQTAQEIVDMVYENPPRKMDAIKILRMETSLGLYDAKMMLLNPNNTKESLFAELCNNFVDDKKDLLRRAIEERVRLEKYIAQLEMEILFEGDK